jgi:peroxiredoxin
MRFACAALFLLSAAVAHADTVAGVVTDPNGMPVKGAKLWLWQETGVLKTESNDAGVFTIPNAGGGASRLVALHEGLALGGTDLQVLGDTDVPLQLGEAVAATLRVVDHEYRPVPGASIKELRLADSVTVPVWELVDHGFPSLRSDDDGVVSVPNLPKGGHYSVYVYHPDYAETRLPYLPVSDKRQPVQVYPGVPVRGRVVSPEGKGIAGARVKVFKQTTGGRRDSAERFTDPEGFYAVRVTPGEYFVEVWGAGYAAPLPRELSVEEGQPATVDVALLPPSRLRGKAVGPDGRPAAGVALRYYIADRFYEERISRKDGTYELVIPAGEGVLRVLAPEGFFTAQDDEIPVRLDRPLDVDLAPIALKALPVIEGRVVTADGAPQPGVLLSTTNVHPAFWLLTDADGRFSFRLERPPQDAKVTFRAEHGFRFLRKDVEVDLRTAPDALEVVLEEFEPDLRRIEPGPTENDLTGLLDEKAPEPMVDTWFNSEPLTLASLKGKVVVMTLWAGFDEIGPTRDRMYEMCALHALYRDAGDVAFLGIHDNLSEPDEIRQFIQNYGIRFPVARDMEKFSTFGRYNTIAIPQTVLIDKAGRIRFVKVDGRLLELVKALRREK